MASAGVSSPESCGGGVEGSRGDGREVLDRVQGQVSALEGQEVRVRYVGTQSAPD
jgi:hypothetical protein